MSQKLVSTCLIQIRKKITNVLKKEEAFEYSELLSLRTGQEFIFIYVKHSLLSRSLSCDTPISSDLSLKCFLLQFQLPSVHLFLSSRLSAIDFLYLFLVFVSLCLSTIELLSFSSFFFSRLPAFSVVAFTFQFYLACPTVAFPI